VLTPDGVETARVERCDEAVDQAVEAVRHVLWETEATAHFEGKEAVRRSPDRSGGVDGAIAGQHTKGHLDDGRGGREVVGIVCSRCPNGRGVPTRMLKGPRTVGVARRTDRFRT
jgi:hypothetical protein